MKKIIVLAVLISFVSCSKNDVSWNPFEPNKKLGAEILLENGLKPKIEVTQECWYSMFKENMQLNLIYHTNDDCQFSTGQEFIITIPKSDSDRKQNTMATDSLEINKMLQKFDAKIISPIKSEKDKFQQIKYVFKAENKSGIKIDWEMFDRINDLELHSNFKE
ncbi:hypothetical protein [Aureivirga sp. CE67]|uniref:hypothetical protein n=1 Tax=Aureivirga sp. CE67 TaxID=1788983 RepID=UPI0018CA40F7|nr:hypothetical protein [Aureivirga sp. CE67]